MTLDKDAFVDNDEGSFVIFSHALAQLMDLVLGDQDVEYVLVLVGVCPYGLERCAFREKYSRKCGGSRKALNWARISCFGFILL